MTKLTALFLISLATTVLSLEPVPFTVNTKKYSHVLDDHFISITVNPTDLLQGKVYGLQMNSTMAILKGLAPAYVRIGSADTAKYTFKRNRYPSDVVKPDDEYTVTETHWIVFNEVAQKAGLDVIVCLNAAHRSEGTKKWDTRNSLELISFSDSQGYNLTWQLGYEVQGGESLSGVQFGKDLNRLRTILNAFPRYQQAKLIGPDIRVIHKKEEIDFWNDVLVEAGPTLDAVTWHPRWPQPSKMKVSDNSNLGYEFPIDYLEWDRTQLSKILQKSIFKNPVWIGEAKRESTGTFAEGLIWARRLILAAKLGIEVVMKQPNLMDITHPKPEYWIALLHKRLLSKSVLETKNVGNNTDLTVISHCTNPYYWSDKPEKLQDGSITVYAVNMGALEQKIQIKGTWSGKSQLLFQYILTSGSDPDSVFSQMTYLNGEPLMMTDDGLLPDIIPKIKKVERSLTMKLQPYSVGFWVVPEAKVKICQLQQQDIPSINIETLTPSKTPKNLENIHDINQFIVEKLKNPESESEEVPEIKLEIVSEESSEKDVSMPKENTLARVARKIRRVNPIDQINEQIKTIMQETQEFLSTPEGVKNFNLKTKLPKASETMEQRIQGLAEGISDAIKSTNQEQEFNKFLEDSGLKQDFGSLIINDQRFPAGEKNFQSYFHSQNPTGHFDEFERKERLRRSISESMETSQEESIEYEEELLPHHSAKFGKNMSLLKDDDEKKNYKQDLVIPHQPNLKGLEERYKKIVQHKLQDEKRKIDDIKKKIKDETEINQKIKPPEKVNEIQEEIIKKEIELLEKTEETVADILKSQKKRQETFEDIIFDELNDVKEERIRELEEMHKNQKKKENTIVKRQVQTPLSKPLLKTVEYIEKNFNLEPESVRKIKRSLEERMGEILRNYDTKKNLEVKKRLAPLKEDRKVTLKKQPKETDGKIGISETKLRSESREKDEEKIVTKERPGEKNVVKKISASQPHHKISKKPSEETTLRKKSEIKKTYEDDSDSFELFNEKKLSEPTKKSDKRSSTEILGDKPTRKLSSKTVQKEEVKMEAKKENKKIKEEMKHKEAEEAEKETKSEPLIEQSPLKNDKERRQQMLQEITLMVNKMNSKEREEGRRREDEDISEEFESDRRPRGIRRLPRKAERGEKLMEPPAEEKQEEIKRATEAPVKPDKLTKLRRNRIKSNRKHKDFKKSEEEETPQRKRHLSGLERPFLEFDKKKLIKPKFRKLNPKFFPHSNGLLTNDKPEVMEIPIQEEKIKAEQKELKTETIVTISPTVLPPKEELKKDLEEFVEEKIFLERGSETSKENSEKNGKKFSRNTTIAEETSTPTESYIIVEPTEDFESDEVGRPEKTAANVIKLEIEKEADEVPKNIKISEEMFEDKKNAIIVTANAEKKGETPQKDVQSADAKTITEIKNIEKELEKKRSSEDTSSLSIEDKVENSMEKIQDDVILFKTKTGSSQRKRRATFLPNHGEEEDEDDYSSEERIQKFKQMIYRKSPNRKPLKNEVRLSSGMGMGADEFLKMAGSTVRVMFDDVIPEAYGQTKNKIQNMGISEYIKEFGNIVQQMKNLDQIFLNIGEAAVKGYIKGNKAEKGPYIQVISRKKRGLKDEDSLAPETEETSSESIHSEPKAIEVKETLIKQPVVDQGTDASSEYATTNTGETSAAVGQLGNWKNTWDVSTPRGEHGKGVYEDDKTQRMETAEVTEDTQKEKTEMAETTVLLKKDEKLESDPKSSKIAHKPKLRTFLEDNAVSRKMIAYVPEDLQEKIFTPWIKTTKDFIQQALTTLQRQRELSEILANDLMNRETAKRTIGKREAGDEEPKLPVYRLVPPTGTKKRDTQQQYSDESLIRHLRGLQPGVYVVPTDEMTNIRSEQITNQAEQKSGMPNVVTLNIYYDKKNSDTKTDSIVTTEPKITQDAVTYYQNKAWAAATDQYNQANQYLAAPDVNLPTSVVSSVNPALQTEQVFAAEPRIAGLPTSRLIQYPAPTYHYPPLQKMYPTIVPNPQTVYSPVYYLPQDARFASHPPGTKRQWREFKARSSGLPISNAMSSGWNIQYDIPLRGSPKGIPSSYNKNYKFLVQDKKRSVGDFKTDPTWSETALPFWKFFSTSEKGNKKVESESSEKKAASVETDSSEEIFAENRKRAKAAVEKKVKTNSIEEVAGKKVAEEEEEEQEVAQEEKFRRRRSVSNSGKSRKVSKRSSGYDVRFMDHDILPEWFGTYREVDNHLDNFPPHVRRSHIISTPWSEEDEELLNFLEPDDELSLVDLDEDDDDYYYSNDNTIQHLRRYPRSTDQFESNMIKTNMIYKMPMDGVHFKPKSLGMTGIKKLTDEDSSLEMLSKSRPTEGKTTPPGEQKAKEVTGNQPQQQPTGAEGVKLTTAQPSLNGTNFLPRNPHDDTFYYFFKYAYDSFVKVMKSMTELF